jgi:hypothetical protein
MVDGEGEGCKHGEGTKGRITYLPRRVFKKILNTLYPAFVSFLVGRGVENLPLPD